LGERLAIRNVFEYGSLMSIDQITAEALRLSPPERALLAESLWESLSDPFEAGDADESSTIELAAERDRQIDAGEVQAISHEELMSRLRR
jgi:putative addiction module component (TIGR02574 family)